MENIFEKEDLKLKKNKDENFQQIAKFGPKTSILSDHGNLVSILIYKIILKVQERELEGMQEVLTVYNNQCF